MRDKHLYQCVEKSLDDRRRSQKIKDPKQQEKYRQKFQRITHVLGVEQQNSLAKLEVLLETRYSWVGGKPYALKQRSTQDCYKEKMSQTEYTIWKWVRI